MSVQVKGSGTIGGLDEGLVVSGIVTSSTQINVGSNIKIGSAGIITASNFKTGVTNLHSTGLTLTGGQLDVGSNIKIGNAGVITATSFVGGVSTFNDDVTFESALSGRQMVWDKSDNALEFGGYAQIKLEDQASIRFGTDEDMILWHNGNHANIKNTTGRLYICLLYTSPSPRDLSTSRMPSSA